MHDENQKLGTFRWTHPHWVTCPLEFKGRKHALMTPGRYTELFFLDEDTALAAGHRLCGKCRRTEFRAFTQAFHAANGTSTLRELDQQLHRARATRSRAQVRCDADASNLPDGTFILVDHRHHLLWQNQALPYSPAGYDQPVLRPNSEVIDLALAPTVAALGQGYRPARHPSATTGS